MRGAGGGILGLGYAVRGIVGMALSKPGPNGPSYAAGAGRMGPAMMGSGMMMSLALSTTFAHLLRRGRRARSRGPGTAGI